MSGRHLAPQALRQRRDGARQHRLRGVCLESVEAASNLATVRTSRRLLTFRAPSGSWSEKRIGLGH